MSSQSTQSKKCTESNYPRWTDLTAFEGNVLYAIARLQGDEETSYGLAIKRVLQDLYETEINHGRLYPALDDLAEYGLIEKSELDKRTNEYELTEVGYHLLRERIDLLADAVVGGDSA
ncbi:helix-turn-helix transcriptional regulator [Halobaculum gomorrense]|uniref:Transcriptional regulator PadR-like family protein n=1 Tax=Halobaculum gomorrense TaxID=43928 RepID=A0A1M5MJY2_9EURY|nr:helix-turn-helix transcriptional regulator [Halobaculum gomorrense]SHG77525.1 Transcriptional regulator PadR-like family protein [Halobaculum gomorrense]